MAQLSLPSYRGSNDEIFCLLGELGDARVLLPLLAQILGDIQSYHCFNAIRELESRGLVAPIFPTEFKYFSNEEAIRNIAYCELKNQRAVKELCLVLLTLLAGKI